MKKILSAFLVFGLFSSGAFAAGDGAKSSISLLAGSASASSNGSGSWTTTGASFEYVLSNFNLGLGMEYLSINSVGFIGAEVNYFVIPEFYVGIQVSSAQSGPSNTLAGLQAGYDFAFQQNFSAGLEGQIMNSTTSGGTSFNVLMANLKYQF